MLQLKSLTFSYNDAITLHPINLTLEKGKILAVIGESGCGKSTLLKLIYGLLDANEGQIFWDNNKVVGPKYRLVPGMEMMKYLAQDFDLMPYITVAENVGTYLSNSNLSKKANRITELLAVVEMSDFAAVKTKHLSGGQLQRIALAKALALNPEVLLLDEPFSHIDCSRKNRLRRNLYAFIKKNQITTIIATHDSTDVLAFADETLVLKNGNLIQHNTTQKLYLEPKNSYVAGLFGDSNEISTQYFEDHFTTTTVLLFPYQFVCVPKSKLKVTVKNSFFKGANYLIEAIYEQGTLFFEHQSALQNGQEVFLINRSAN